MTAYEVLEKKYNSLKENLDKWEDKFPGQGPEEVAEKLKLVNKKTREAEDQAQEFEKTKQELASVKKELNEFKNTPPVDSQELAEWRKIFPGQSPKETAEKQEKFAKVWVEQTGRLVELQKRVEETTKKTDSPNPSEFLGELANTILGEKGVIMTCTKAGENAMPLVGTSIGAIGGGLSSIGIGLIGTGTYFVDKGINVGGHIFERSIEEGKEVYKTTLESGTEVAIQAGTGAVSVIKEGMKHGDEARRELKEFSESMAKTGLEGFGITVDAVEKWRDGLQVFSMCIADNTKDVYESTRQGAENVTLKLLDNTKEVTNSFLSIFGGGTDALKAKIEMLEKEIEKKDKEIAEKNIRIKELEQKHESLTVQTLQIAASSRPSSPTPVRGEEEMNRFRTDLEEQKREVRDLKQDVRDLKQEMRVLKQSQQTAQIEVPTNR